MDLLSALWEKFCYCGRVPLPTSTEEDSDLVTYSMRDLSMATKNFSDSNLVGKGSFSRVYRADLGGNRIVAVKRLLQVDREGFANELSILLTIPKHEYIVNFVGICAKPDAHMLVFEYIDNGSLYHNLHEKKGVGRPLSWAARKKIARQVAEALRHLHKTTNPQIIHRDLKSKNVLLDHDLSAKLADFGIAKFGPKNNRSTGTTPRGTFGYMDPQCVREHKCSAKSDVYSYGVLLLELITGSKALIGSESLVIRTRKDRRNRESMMRIVDQTLIHRNNRNELLQMMEIANRCLRSNRNNRPSMAEIVNRMQEIGIHVL